MTGLFSIVTRNNLTIYNQFKNILREVNINGKCQGRSRDTLLNGNTEALQPSANLCFAQEQEVQIRLCQKISQTACTTLKKNPKNKETQGQVFTDECKINFYQNVEKRKVWGRRETTHDPMHITSVKHGGGGVMSWAACVYWWFNCC